MTFFRYLTLNILSSTPLHKSQTNGCHCCLPGPKATTLGLLFPFLSSISYIESGMKFYPLYFLNIPSLIFSSLCCHLLNLGAHCLSLGCLLESTHLSPCHSCHKIPTHTHIYACMHFLPSFIPYATRGNFYCPYLMRSLLVLKIFQ